MPGLACLREDHRQAGFFSGDRWHRPSRWQASPGGVRGKERLPGSQFAQVPWVALW